MTNKCRINYIILLTVLDMLLSHIATRFEILPLVFPNRQFDIHPEI